MTPIYNPDSIYPNMIRNQKVQRLYQKRLDLIEKAGITPEEFIIRNHLTKTDISLQTNSFPYSNPQYKQYILWLMCYMTEKDIIEYVLERLPNTVFIGINKPEKQSVKNLVHYHIFTTL